MTFAAAAQTYLNEQTKQLTSRRHIERILVQHFADLARVPLDELKREQIMAIVSKVTADRPDTAVKLLHRAKLLTRWALVTGLCEVDRLASLDRKVLLPNYDPAAGAAHPLRRRAARNLRR
ncbi:MAG TPA: hypothetical protein VLI21_03645 [Casimicrobiaceae bacterium]|nr:hypothetical protein [Casimicrobiaceae bacterium]